VTLRFSGAARDDLLTINEHLLIEAPESAEAVVARILQTAALLEAFPSIGRPGRVPETRELKVPRLPYILIYTLNSQSDVDIERVLHSKRQYP